VFDGVGRKTAYVFGKKYLEKVFDSPGAAALLGRAEGVDEERNASQETEGSGARQHSPYVAFRWQFLAVSGVTILINRRH
jgi:hypothetical protein